MNLPLIILAFGAGAIVGALAALVLLSDPGEGDGPGGRRRSTPPPPAPPGRGGEAPVVGAVRTASGERLVRRLGAQAGVPVVSLPRPDLDFLDALDGAVPRGFSCLDEGEIYRALSDLDRSSSDRNADV